MTQIPLGGQCGFAGCSSSTLVAFTYRTRGANTATRTVLTQFGYAHGWRMADSIAHQFEWDSDEDKRFVVSLASRLHALGFKLVATSGTVLTGAAGSGGTATGRARVVLDAADPVGLDRKSVV